jgi:fluoride exporter
MNNWLIVALGGAIGAMSRYAINRAVASLVPAAANFPFATLIENSVGAFCAGFLAVFITARIAEGQALRLLLSVGFLGAFTTFSAFSVETISLLGRGDVTKALLNVVLNVCLCLWLCSLGMQLVRR